MLHVYNLQKMTICNLSNSNFKFEFRDAFSFSYIWKDMVTFRQFFVNPFSKFDTSKGRKQQYVYWNYNDASVIYSNSNMALLRVRKH